MHDACLLTGRAVASVELLEETTIWGSSLRWMGRVVGKSEVDDVLGEAAVAGARVRATERSWVRGVRHQVERDERGRDRMDKVMNR